LDFVEGYLIGRALTAEHTERENLRAAEWRARKTPRPGGPADQWTEAERAAFTRAAALHITGARYGNAEAAELAAAYTDYLVAEARAAADMKAARAEATATRAAKLAAEPKAMKVLRFTGRLFGWGVAEPR
jgi:hypothetical protein